MPPPVPGSGRRLHPGVRPLCARCGINSIDPHTSDRISTGVCCSQTNGLSRGRGLSISRGRSLSTFPNHDTDSRPAVLRTSEESGSTGTTNTVPSEVLPAPIRSGLSRGRGISVGRGRGLFTFPNHDTDSRPSGLRAAVESGSTGATNTVPSEVVAVPIRSSPIIGLGRGRGLSIGRGRSMLTSSDQETDSRPLGFRRSPMGRGRGFMKYLYPEKQQNEKTDNAQLQPSNVPVTESVSDEDCLLFIENVESVLDCKICLNVMIPPIFYCRNGHDICSKCREQVEICPTCRSEYSGARNIVVEHILTKVLCDCKYKGDGCAATLTRTKLVEHESTCMYGKFECRFSMGRVFQPCGWKGSKTDLMRHLDDVHIPVVTETLQYRIESSRQSCIIHICLGEMFWLYTNKDVEAGIFEVLQYIGSPENADSFRYKITYRNISESPVVSYTDTTPSIEKDFSSLCKERRCFYMPIQTFNRLCEAGAVSYELSVFKPDEPEDVSAVVSLNIS